MRSGLIIGALLLGIAGMALTKMQPYRPHQSTQVLTEHIGRAWAPEVLTYHFSATLAEKVLPASLRVTTPAGPVPAQLIRVETYPNSPYVKSATLALVSGMQPRETKTFTVAGSSTPAPPLTTDLATTAGKESAEIVTSQFGLRLLLGAQAYAEAKHPTDVPGPVLGMRLPDGRWFGGSRMYGARKIIGYEAKIIEQGPALVEWRAHYLYDGGGVLTVTIQLGAGLARALWQTQVTGEDLLGGWILSLSPGLDPLWLVWRPEYQHNRWGTFAIEHGRPNGWGDQPKNVRLEPDPEGELTKLTPWNDWWDGTTQTGWAFKEGPDKPAFIVRRADPGAWVEPAPPGTWAPNSLLLKKMLPLWKEEDGEITIHVNNAAGVRKWWLGSGKLGDGEQACPATASTPDFDPSLNAAKEFVLDWPQTVASPHLFLSKAELEQVWQRADPAAVEAFITTRIGANPGPMVTAPWISESAVAAWLMRGTPEVAKRVNFVEQSRFWLKELGEYHWAMPMMIISMYDAVAGSGYLSKEDAALFRAQLAYLGYMLDDPAAWSIERGYCSGNQDMSVGRILSKGLLACALPDHPRAKKWAEDANRMMEKWLAEMGPAGEWPESASGYTVVSMSPMLTYALAAQRAGLGNYLLDPRMKAFVLCMAKQYSPPDPRTGGQAGNAMKAGESRLPPCGDAIAFGMVITGLMARGTLASDPEYAHALQWVWKRSGMAKEIGGWRMGGWDQVCADPALPAKTPNWTLDIFPRLGAVLHGGLDSGTEDFLYLITSDNLNAMQSESGSIASYFGKGVPLVQSFLGRYTWRQTHLANRVMPAIKKPANQANQPIAWDSGENRGIWSEKPHALFGERVGPSTTTASADLPWAAYVQADFAFRREMKIPFSEQIPDMPDWPEFIDGYGKLPLDWQRQVLSLRDDAPGGDHYLVVRDTVQGGATRWQMWNASEKLGAATAMADRDAALQAKPGNVIVPAEELPQGDRYTAVGRFGVDLEYFIASPADTPRYTLRWGTKYYQYNTLAGYEDFQDLLHLQMPGDGAYFVVLFPRAAGAKAPAFSTLGDGTIIKVAGDFGTDYAFLAHKFTESTGDGAAFAGTAGAVQDRTGALVLTLAAPGRVRFKGYGLESAAPASLRVEKAIVTVALARGATTGTVTLTLPGAWKLARPIADVTLTKTATGYTIAMVGAGPVGLVKE